MLRRVFLPQLGQTMEEGTIERWLKREGERVRKGEVLYELTTDKATLEVESFADGVLKKIVVGGGQTMPVNALIAVIGDEEDELPADLTEFAGKPSAPAPVVSPGATGPAPTPLEAPPGGAVAEPSASPRARKIAAEKKVPLAALRGSGPGGRIVERDVIEYLTDLGGVRRTPAAVAHAYDAGVNLLHVAAGVGARRVRKEDVEAAVRSGLGRSAAALPAGERLPLSPMRRTIAERMTAAKQAAPHFYLVGHISARAALDLLKRAEAAGGRPTVTALLVKAVALALKKHPRVNARFDGDAVVLRQDCNVGVAVAVEDGLFVPVVRGADAKGLAQISAELRSLAETARAGKLIPEQYEGGCITISNLGMYGVDYFLPIINPPESCIVGVGAISDQVVVRDGGIAVEAVMKVSLSADHRILSGVEAAQFFQTLKALIEDPGQLAS